MTDRPYTLEFTPAAARQLRKLSRPAAARIRDATEALRDDPRPRGVKALAERGGQLRIRVGDYRVIYTLQDDRLTVLVLQLGHRRDIYEQRSH